MTCPACSAPMNGPVQITLDGRMMSRLGWVLAHRWTCPCGCVVVVPVGEGRT